MWDLNLSIDAINEILSYFRKLKEISDQTLAKATLLLKGMLFPLVDLTLMVK